jgi:hypothetical protein
LISPGLLVGSRLARADPNIRECMVFESEDQSAQVVNLIARANGTLVDRKAGETYDPCILLWHG